MLGDYNTHIDTVIATYNLQCKWLILITFPPHIPPKESMPLSKPWREKQILQTTHVTYRYVYAPRSHLACVGSLGLGALIVASGVEAW